MPLQPCHIHSGAWYDQSLSNGTDEMNGGQPVPAADRFCRVRSPFRHAGSPDRFPMLMTAHCLTHQLPADQASPVGLVCARCKQRLYLRPPRGHRRSYWESQPVAYSLAGEPWFVYTLLWDDLRIRCMHPPEEESPPAEQESATLSRTPLRPDGGF